MTNETVRYFIPICLYPHTTYRTRVGLEALFSKYALDRHQHLIVIADRLLALDRLVSGRYALQSSVFRKARREAEQIRKLVRNVAFGAKAASVGRIAFWDEVADCPHFENFSNRLGSLALADELLAGKIAGFVNARVARFGVGAVPDREQHWEQQYLLSELCMSVFCTEMLGYSLEVWERPPAPEAPDPLKVLYTERSALVAEATGRVPARKLSFLFGSRPG
jgi:hypothetical protein